MRGTLVLDTLLGGITLTGTVDTSGASITFTGTATTAFGRFHCTGQIVDGSLRGLCTGADGKPRNFDSRLVGAAPITRYCGTWTNTSSEPLGAFNVLTSGGYAAAVFSSPAVSGVAAGTLTGTTMMLTLPLSGSATGTTTGTTISGTWTAPGFGTGTFSGTTDQCPRLSTANPDTGNPDAAAPRDAADLDASSRADAGAPDGAIAPDARPALDAAIANDATVATDGMATTSGPACPTAAQQILPLDQPLQNTVIAAANGYVFFQDGTFIMRLGRDGRSLERFAQLRDPVLTMAAGEGLLCYAEGTLNVDRNSFIYCKRIDDLQAMPVVVSGAVAPITMTMAAGHVYWNSRLNGIWVAEPREGSPKTHIVEAAQDLPTGNEIYAIAATRNWVYFSHRTSGNDHAVYSYATTRTVGDGTRPLVRSTSGPPVQFMSADGRQVYWIRYLSQGPNTFGRIEGYDEQTGLGGMVAHEPQNPGALLTSSGFIYFGSQYGLAKLSPTARDPMFLHTGRFSWTFDTPDLPFAVDDSCLFWQGVNRGIRGLFAGPK